MINAERCIDALGSRKTTEEDMKMKLFTSGSVTIDVACCPRTICYLRVGVVPASSSTLQMANDVV